METANILLRDWRDINKSRSDKTATAPRKQLTMADSPTTAMSNLRIEASPPDYSRPPPAADPRYAPDPRDPRYYQQQQQQQQQQPPVHPQHMPPPAQAPYPPGPPGARPPPGGPRVTIPPGYETPQQTRPPPGAYEPASTLSPEGYPVSYPVRLLDAIEGFEPDQTRLISGSSKESSTWRAPCQEWTPTVTQSGTAELCASLRATVDATSSSAAAATCTATYTEEKSRA
jgi:hypothetical protein